MVQRPKEISHDDYQWQYIQWKQQIEGSSHWQHHVIVSGFGVSELPELCFHTHTVMNF